VELPRWNCPASPVVSVTCSGGDSRPADGDGSRSWLRCALALAGCTDSSTVQEVRAGSSGPAPTVPPGSPPDTATSSPPDEGATAGRPGQVDPSPPRVPPGGTEPPAAESPPVTGGPGDGRLPHRWERYTVASDGRTLTFTYYAGVEPCSVPDSIVADEQPDTVEVTVYERPGPPGVACIMLAQEKSAVVTLAAPLGARTVVDGAP
jgi:hypothetical protein